MRMNRTGASCAALVMALATHHAAMAQGSDADGLMAMDTDTLRGEIGNRFDGALAATNNPAFISADDARYLWAIEAKAQCGIALGYLKSSTKDPVSIGKCAKAYQLMQYVAVPPPPPPPPPPPLPIAPAAPSQVCENPAIIFFEFNSPIPPEAETQQVMSFISGNYRTCGWNSLTVVGHADRSGSNAYNNRLSQARANNVADMLRPAVPGTNVSVEFRGEEEPRVPTEDGVRELQNRRVEILVR